LLRRFLGSCRANTDVDLHGGVFGEDDVAAARNEMYVDRSARAQRAHGDAERIRTSRYSHRDAHELESTDTARGLIQYIGVAITGGRDGSQPECDSRLQIARLGRGGLCPAFGIELEVVGFAGLNSGEGGTHLLVEPARQNEIMKDEPELTVAAHMECRLDLNHGALQDRALRQNQAVATKEGRDSMASTSSPLCDVAELSGVTRRARTKLPSGGAELSEAASSVVSGSVPKSSGSRSSPK